jgi:prepilin-type N-terminal cleavage/methylation domain-containing protein
MPRIRSRTARSQPAFTLVELMIVCVVIALLLGILVPVLSRAYNTALTTADSALLHQISMGCETYQQAFHAYPSSAWVDSSSTLATKPTGWWPPPPMPSGSTNIETDMIALTGAAKAFASLAGFNTIGDGTNAVGCGDADFLNWRYPCGQLTHRGILVPETPLSLNEKQPPYGPYYLASDKQHAKVGVTWNATADQPQEVFTSRFQLENVPAGGDPNAGAPILYYLANAAPRDTDGNGTKDSWDIYDYADNYLITDSSPALAALNPETVAPGERWRHPLYAPSDGKTGMNGIYDSVTTANFGTLTNQYFGISRPFTKGTTASPVPVTPRFATPAAPTIPYNANTFILISPGPDGRYFTADDISNFK